MPVSVLPGGRGDGQPITTLIDFEPGTQIAHYLAAAPGTQLVLAGTQGYGFVAQVADLVSRQKAGKTFLTLEAAERPLLALMPSAAGAATHLAVLASSGRLLTFPIDEIKHQPKGGRGLTLIELDAKETVLSVACFTATLKVIGTGREQKPRKSC